MNEIEKLYESVGLSTMWVEEYLLNNVDTIRIYHSSYNEMIKSMMKKNDWSRSEAIEVAKKECRKEHPPFTAEKQLKLVDWFIRNEADIETNFEYNDELYYLKSYDKQTIECKDFAEALANLVNIHFKDFTNIEKQQIKEVLK